MQPPAVPSPAPRRRTAARALAALLLAAVASCARAPADLPRPAPSLAGQACEPPPADSLDAAAPRYRARLAAAPDTLRRAGDAALLVLCGADGEPGGAALFRSAR